MSSQKDSAQLLAGIETALKTLDDAELQLICLGVLHGMPISQLASAANPQDCMLVRTLSGTLVLVAKK